MYCAVLCCAGTQRGTRCTYLAQQGRALPLASGSLEHVLVGHRARPFLVFVEPKCLSSVHHCAADDGMLKVAKPFLSFFWPRFQIEK